MQRAGTGRQWGNKSNKYWSYTSHYVAIAMMYCYGINGVLESLNTIGIFNSDSIDCQLVITAITLLWNFAKGLFEIKHSFIFTHIFCKP